jgi:nitrous oxidase accessory protein NosD
MNTVIWEWSSTLRQAGARTALLAIAALAVIPAGAQARSSQVSCPADDLQGAIDAASTGDVLEITGTCTGNFSVPGGGSAAKLTLEGLDGAKLDGAHSGSAILADHATLSLRNLRVQNGQELFGGGVNVSSGELRLHGVTIAGNAACAGGGVYLSDSRATIVATSLHDNQAGGIGPCPYVNGGGIEVDLGSRLEMAHGDISDNRAVGNSAGGGMDLFGSTVEMDDVTVSHNRAGYNAGGISDEYGSHLTLADSIVRDNRARDNSGGGLALDGASARILRSTFIGNRAGNAGGAIISFADVADDPNGVTGNSHLYIRGSRLAHNVGAHEGGGAILNYATNYAGANAGEHGTIATLTIERSKIRSNRATPDGAAGGVWNSADPGGEATTTLIETHVRGNKAAAGGGLVNNRGDPQGPLGGFAKLFLTKKTSITNNSATDHGGGALNGPGSEIHLSGGSTITHNDPDNCSGC